MTPRFDYFATGPRMGLKAAHALEAADALNTLHIDAWVRPGRPAAVTERILGPRTQNRVIRGIPAHKVHAHPELFVLARVKNHMFLAGRDAGAVDRLLERTYRAVAGRCTSPAVFGMQYSSLELFAGREVRIMEQFSAPPAVERRIAEEELLRWEGWAKPGIAHPRRMDERNALEWEAADVVWAPSEHVVVECVACGADRRKFEVVPYPIPPPKVAPRIRHPRRPLRAVFAGTLSLQKGVQYIYQALRDWNRGWVDMHFFGPSQLTPKGLACLSEVGTVHGAVPRVQLLDEFARSDLLLFPSLSEGSALVTAEAASVGLPVIATHESGPPASALLVESRSGSAIQDALSELLENTERLEQALRDGLAEAERRSTALFNSEIARLIDDASRSRSIIHA